MGRRAWVTVGLGLVSAAVAAVATVPSARADSEPIVPSPPLTVPPLDAPAELEPALTLVAPATTFACAAYGSTAFTTDFVLGLVLPLVISQSAPGVEPPDFRPVGEYLRLVAPACGFVPIAEVPGGCAADELTSAQVASALAQVIPSTLRSYVGVPVPRVGLVPDTLAALERLLSGGTDVGLSDAVNAALDCHGLDSTLKVAASGTDDPPILGTAPTTPPPPPPPAASAPPVAPRAASPVPTPAPEVAKAPAVVAATEEPPTTRLGGWAWGIVGAAAAALALSRVRGSWSAPGASDVDQVDAPD